MKFIHDFYFLFNFKNFDFFSTLEICKKCSKFLNQLFFENFQETFVFQFQIFSKDFDFLIFNIYRFFCLFLDQISGPDFSIKIRIFKPKIQSFNNHVNFFISNFAIYIFSDRSGWIFIWTAQTPFFRRVLTSVQNLTPEIIFSNDELHIFLKLRNLEICNHQQYKKQKKKIRVLLIIDDIVF